MWTEQHDQQPVNQLVAGDAQRCGVIVERLDAQTTTLS
jgi:hypothetical protein